MTESTFVFLVDLERTPEFDFDTLAAQSDSRWVCLGLLSDTARLAGTAPAFARRIAGDARFAVLGWADLPEVLLSRADAFAVILDGALALAPDLLARLRAETEASEAEPGLLLCLPDHRAQETEPPPKRFWDSDLALARDSFGAVKVLRAARLAGWLSAVDLGEAAWPYGVALLEAASLGRERVRVLDDPPYHPLDGREDGERKASELRLARAVLPRFGRHLQLVETGEGERRLLAAPPRWPRVSVIIPTRDQLYYLRRCVDDLLQATDYPALEILIVDNNSEEPETLAYLEKIAAQPKVRVVPARVPFNYPKINNLAVEQAGGEVLLFLNNDISVLEPGWLKEMVSQALRSDVGAVGSLLFYPDGRIQHAGVLLGADGGIAGHIGRLCEDAWIDEGPGRAVQESSAVTAACMAMRRSVFDEIGGFDPNLAVSYNDVDLCLRAWRHGFRVVWTPFARLVHHESVSRGSDDLPENRERALGEYHAMRARWGVFLQRDTHYSAAFSTKLPGYQASNAPPRTN